MKFYFFLLATFLFTNCSSTQRALRIYGDDFFQHWVHSHEDDHTGIKVYRPADYAFPPSRGREGFELEKDGVYKHYTVGTNDVPETFTGTWKMKGKSTLIITLTQPEVTSAEKEIISLSKEMLKIVQ